MRALLTIIFVLLIFCQQQLFAEPEDYIKTCHQLAKTDGIDQEEYEGYMRSCVENLSTPVETDETQSEAPEQEISEPETLELYEPENRGVEL